MKAGTTRKIHNEQGFIDFLWTKLFEAFAQDAASETVSITEISRQIALSGRKRFEDEDARAEYVLRKVVKTVNGKKKKAGSAKKAVVKI